jgi:hypothetical protein
MQEQYNKIRDQVRKLELMLLVYGNEICDEVRLKQLTEEHKKINLELLDILDQDNTL